MQSTDKISVGIVGGAGYTAGELLRILINHPMVDIGFVQSKSHAGKPLSDAHGDLYGETDLLFSEGAKSADLLFLCQGHGKSREVLEGLSLSAEIRIIDLSSDFRLQDSSVFKNQQFIYGLPELYKDKICQASHIANPGCFATAIQLALLPLAKHQLISEEMHVYGITGSTGAGQSLSDTSHFSWRNNNVSVYKAFNHQHLFEIRESLNTLQNKIPELNFVPVRGNFTRGIHISAYTRLENDLEEIKELYLRYYKDSPFVEISDRTIHLKQVVNTNKCLLHLEKHGDKLLVTSIIDNLVKGASGQAVQNMNLMYGWEEKTGLQLKSVAF